MAVDRSRSHQSGGHTGASDRTAISSHPGSLGSGFQTGRLGRDRSDRSSKSGPGTLPGWRHRRFALRDADPPEEFLARLELGKQIRREADGWVIAITSGEVKNGIAKEVRVPERLGRILDHYVDEIRPQLLTGRDSRRLWISETGGDLTQEAIHDQIKKVSRRFAQEPLALTYSGIAPLPASPRTRRSSPTLSSTSWGHTTSITSDHYYKRANSIEASRRLTAAIQLELSAENNGAGCAA